MAQISHRISFVTVAGPRRPVNPRSKRGKDYRDDCADIGEAIIKAWTTVGVLSVSPKVDVDVHQRTAFSAGVHKSASPNQSYHQPVWAIKKSAAILKMAELPVYVPPAGLRTSLDDFRDYLNSNYGLQLSKTFDWRAALNIRYYTS